MAEPVAQAAGTGGGAAVTVAIAVAVVVIAPVAVVVGRVPLVTGVPAARVVCVPLAHVDPLPVVPGDGRGGAHGVIMCV